MEMDRRAFLAFGGAAMVVGVAVTFPFERGADATQPWVPSQARHFPVSQYG